MVSFPLNLCWLCRGSVGSLRAVAAVKPCERGFADDVRGFWAVAHELLTGRSVLDILNERYMDINSNPYLQVHLHGDSCPVPLTQQM